jgi:putative CocE/NonD family hydrolase
MHKYPVCMHLPGAAYWCWENIVSETKLALRSSVPKRPFKKYYHQEMLRWYDYHLKGIDNGVMDEPPVQIWVRGADRFRYADEWPLRSETEWREYYLRYPGRLDEEGPPADEPTSVLEYEAQPPGAMVGTNAAGGQPEHLSFTSAPFEQDTEVVGPLALYLWAALDTTDGHFIATVKDVEPDGSNRILTRGWLKASHRELDEAKSGRWRPYHPHTDPEPVEPGAVNRYAIEIQPIANLFEAGHQLELEIWPMDYPAEDYYDQTLLWGRVHHIPHGEDVTYDIHHDSSRPSHLLVPVVDEG